MLGVGIDWSEEFHLVALVRPGQGVVEVIETRRGLLVERLVDAGYVVVPVNPDLVAPGALRDLIQDRKNPGWTW